MSEEKTKAQYHMEIVNCLLEQGFEDAPVEALIMNSAAYLMIDELKKNDPISFQITLIQFMLCGTDFWFMDNDISFNNYVSEPQEVTRLW